MSHSNNQRKEKLIEELKQLLEHLELSEQISTLENTNQKIKTKLQEIKLTGGVPSNPPKSGRERRRSSKGMTTTLLFDL